MGRATGRLTLKGPDGAEARLFFLFGKLYHAEDGRSEGQAVVDTVMAWPQFTSDFDKNARLVSYETIGAEAEAAAIGDPEENARRARAEVARLRRQALFLLALFLLGVAAVLFVLYGRR